MERPIYTFQLSVVLYEYGPLEVSIRECGELFCFCLKGPGCSVDFPHPSPAFNKSSSPLSPRPNHPLPFSQTLPRANMTRSSNTSKITGRSILFLRLYAIWRKERRVLGLSCSPRHSSKILNNLHQNLKTKRDVRPHGASKLPELTEPSYHLEEDSAVDVGSPDSAPETQPPLYPEEDESSAGDVGSPDPTPEAQPSGSLPSECGSFSGLDGSISAGPSTPYPATPAGPSPVSHEPYLHAPANELPYHGPFYEFPHLGPSSAMRKPFTPTPFEGPQFSHPSSFPLSAPIPSYPSSGIYQFQDQNVFRGEELYKSLSAPQQATDCLGPFPQITSTTDEPGPPARVATTSTTEYDSKGCVTPWYTPGVITQNLPVEPDDDRFVFNSVKPTALDYPVWNTSPTFDHMYFRQPTPAHRPLVVPPPAPVPVVKGQAIDSVDIQWWNIARILESDRPEAITPFPTNDQNPSLAPVQQALSVLDCDQGDKFRTLQRQLVNLERNEMLFAPPSS